MDIHINLIVYELFGFLRKLVFFLHMSNLEVLDLVEQVMSSSVIL